METRKEAVRALKACRFCLGRGDLTSIYDKSHQSAAVPLPLQIMSCVSIEVFPSDGMPSLICNRCAFFITQGYQFKQICRAADEQLLRFVQTGDPTSAVPWPKELLETDAARLAPKYADAAKEEYDEDESEDDVFNINIETEGSGEDRGLARIKVTQRDGQIHIEEDTDQQESESVEVSPKKERPTSAYPCPQCARVFPLRQLQLLHIKQHHRKRSFECPYCSSKFFSKHDLGAHLDTHSEESPFECRACGHQFKRYTLMKKHEKAKHPDLRTYACKTCSETFVAHHELLAHERRHKAYDDRPFACPVRDPPCSSKFRKKQTLTRHIELVHSAGTFSCEHCSKKFTSGARLARHVKEHAGQRPYPCKYCDKTFIKSHHHTRHLRVAHSHLSRRMHSGVGEEDVHQCSECTETFTSQESLAYHEAKHAAQSLTCPLCQERFDGVEAVTAHVKLHADQDCQFMCDFCELMFVTEARLDQHMLDQHSDEMDAKEAEEDSAANEREMPSLRAQEELQMVQESEAEPVQFDEEADTEEITYAELATVDTLSMARVQRPVTPVTSDTPATPSAPAVPQEQSAAKTPVSSILRKAEEVKRRAFERTQSELSPAKQRLKMAAGGAAILRKTVSPEKRPNGETPAESPQRQKLATPEKQEVKEVIEKTKEVKSFNLEKRAEEKISNEDKKDREDKRDFKKYREDKKEKHDRDDKGERYSNKHVEKEERKDNPSEKSLRLLERDLQEMKRVADSRADKPPMPRGRGRPPLTPAQRLERARDKMSIRSAARAGLVSSRAEPTRRLDDRPKEPKKLSLDKDDADNPTRRSSRASKVKDYAKMVNDSESSLEAGDADSSGSDLEAPKPRPQPVVTPSQPVKRRGRPPKYRVFSPATPAASAALTATLTTPVSAKRRGRPPVDKEMKKRKADEEDVEDYPSAVLTTPVAAKTPVATPDKMINTTSADVVMTHTGQTLTKVPASLIKSLPPGVKPLPLPPQLQKSMSAASGICEMKLGEKTVKVQKIVMTKAEVEEMKKKGLLEMKHGTMVLKAPTMAGKLPTGDPGALRSFVRAAMAEGPAKTGAGADGEPKSGEPPAAAADIC